ncbi:MAG: membrane protein insertase YidC [Gammaproteobacteria bacterium]|nr:membrane protein insertase YidC [Gammaproteobacteria bacterium]
MPTTLINYLRMMLYTAIVVIVYMAFQLWQKEHPAPETQTTQAQVATTTDNQSTLPQQIISDAKQAAAPANVSTSNMAVARSLIHVTTDVFQITIDSKGGNIVGLNLLKYPAKLHDPAPVVLLNDDPVNRYIAQSGLFGESGPDNSNGEASFTSSQSSYTLSPDQNTLEVRLNWRNAQGVQFTKIYTFKRNDYAIGMQYEIKNASKKPWSGNLFLQLLRKNIQPEAHHGLMMGLSTYFGAAISSPEKPFQKISFSKMDKTPLDQNIQKGWVAMMQHYFVSAWVPSPDITARYFSRVTSDGLHAIGIFAPTISVNPGETLTTGAQLYAGPEIVTQLEKVSPTLKLTIDYGWLWMISVAIFWLMQKIYAIVGNWGWSIVIVTLLIKLMFYHLSAKSYRSMSGLKKLQPKINALKERFGDDRQKITQATLELYRKEKVNPMSGCLPILIQIPVFIALYWVLIESVQLRQAPFMFWIQDLSVSDPYYILPVLMGLSMFLQQRLNPPAPDPTQAKIMMLMPVVFTVMFAGFPAGLMLYWFVNNTLSFLQQWFIMHRMDKAEKALKAN